MIHIYNLIILGNIEKRRTEKMFLIMLFSLTIGMLLFILSLKKFKNGQGKLRVSLLCIFSLSLIGFAVYLALPHRTM